MKNKRGQFYLVAVIIIISVFIGFVTITNYVKIQKNVPFFEIEEELKIERRNLFDYILHEGLTASDINDTFFDFSDQYVSEIGPSKNSVFIFGTENEIYFNGNRLSQNEILFNCSTDKINITQVGNFLRSCDPTIEEIKIYLDGQEYLFKIYEGQNFYYLINYVYEEERFNIYG